MKASQTTNPAFSLVLLHPKYLPTWLLMGLLWLVVMLPYPLLVGLGKMIGWIVLLFARDRKKITLLNLQLCFPDQSSQWRQKILRQSFESAGMAVLEMGMAWWWPQWRLRRLCRVEGLEHIENLNGQGSLLLGMHFTTLDIAGAFLALYQPYGAMYRPHRNPVFNLLQYRGRQRMEDLVIFPREDLRTMVRLLKKGELVWYAPDQDYGAQYSVFAPFFGILAATITATSKLVSMGRSAVLPFTHERLPWCRGYKITIHSPLENYPIGDEVRDAEQINQLVEQKVSQLPAQYLWAHRRFKTRPEGEADVYGIKKKKRRKR